jgi:hypothetical protein
MAADEETRMWLADSTWPNEKDAYEMIDEIGKPDAGGL